MITDPIEEREKVSTVPSRRLTMVPRSQQLRLSEIDRAELLARLMRAQTDLLILAGDNRVPKEDRDKLRLAADVAGEVRLG